MRLGIDCRRLAYGIRAGIVAMVKSAAKES
jgi:hypothetical protein